MVATIVKRKCSRLLRPKATIVTLRDLRESFVFEVLRRTLNGVLESFAYACWWAFLVVGCRRESVVVVPHHLC